MSLLLSLADKCEMSCSSLRGGAEAISCDDGEKGNGHSIPENEKIHFLPGYNSGSGSIGMAFGGAVCQ